MKNKEWQYHKRYHDSNGQSREAKTLDARIFNCKECIKIFTQKSSLSRHLKGHGLKAYHCKDCEASFAHKDYLEKHLMTHSKPDIMIEIPSLENQNKTCFVCNKTFSRTRFLRNHEKLHIENKRPGSQ